MLSFRDGAEVTVCDDCYRVKPHNQDGSVEAGWYREPDAIHPAPFTTTDRKRGGEPIQRSGMTVAQPQDWCPDCMEKRRPK